MRTRRGMTQAEALAHLTAHVTDLLGGPAKAAKAGPRMLASAASEATAKLSRPARRALGQRSDARYHPLAARKDIVRSRNAR